MKWSLENRIYVYSFIEGLAVILGWTQSRIDFCQALYAQLGLTKGSNTELATMLGRLPLEYRLQKILQLDSEIVNFVKEAMLDIIIVESHNKFTLMIQLQLFNLSKYLSL